MSNEIKARTRLISHTCSGHDKGVILGLQRVPVALRQNIMCNTSPTPAGNLYTCLGTLGTGIRMAGGAQPAFRHTKPSPVEGKKYHGQFIS